MTRSLHFAELHLGSSIRYQNILFGNYFLKCNRVKIILVSFNCFSEYIMDIVFLLHTFSLTYILRMSKLHETPRVMGEHGHKGQMMGTCEQRHYWCIWNARKHFGLGGTSQLISWGTREQVLCTHPGSEGLQSSPCIY